MKAMKIFNRISISVLLIVVSGVAFYKVAQWYYCLPPPTSYLPTGACMTEDEVTFKNVGNAEIRVVDTSWDTFGSEEFVDVYAFKNDASTVLPRWLRKRTEVFVYDPGTTNNLPRFEVMASNRIKVSIPEVSSILRKGSSWDRNALEYDIGKVNYPSANVAVRK